MNNDDRSAIEAAAVKLSPNMQDFILGAEWSIDYATRKLASEASEFDQCGFIYAHPNWNYERLNLAKWQHEQTAARYEAKLRLSDTIISQLQRAQKVAIALVEKERDELAAKVKEFEKKINSK